MDPKRLIDLNPRWLGAGGEGVTDTLTGLPAPAREGVGIELDCPCGNADEEHRLYVPFANPLDGGPTLETRGWQRTGDTFETLTLTPSILRNPIRGGCGWHGFITGGQVTTC